MLGDAKLALLLIAYLAQQLMDLLLVILVIVAFTLRATILVWHVILPVLHAMPHPAWVLSVLRIMFGILLLLQLTIAVDHLLHHAMQEALLILLALDALVPIFTLLVLALPAQQPIVLLALFQQLLAHHAQQLAHTTLLLLTVL